ncbi:hypothetical protein DYI95_006030 [Thermaerobacter sp. PB12/4term]|uniref:Tad domain-containing protein n=1 Tax=Thermaerobacter sp. PB12/4term TaxID=2293838 RepID=UPI000E32A731|nr:Tad domain-containing protein [Thermaerobacter sp. PB12/4term]QIA27136.1 hypothetical protein DYI95_006030 [Thermaerobacter sp. PB12/4term]
MRCHRRVGFPGAGDGSRSQQGGVAVLVAISLAVLLGMAGLAVDGGRLYAERARLQAATDAAALAGAAALPEEPARARDLAEEYLRRNGVDAGGARIQIGPGGRTLRVEAAATVPLGLARVLGPEAVPVRAAATAAVAAARAVRGVQPYGVDEQVFLPGHRYTLVLDRPGSPGNFHLLALGGRGADTVRDNIRHGYPGWVRAGDELETEPGRNTGAVAAYRERLEADPHSTYENFRADSPRVVIVPVIRGFDAATGRDRVTVTGFAAFFLEEAREGEGQVVGRFIRLWVEGEAGGDPEGAGVRVVRLVD